MKDSPAMRTSGIVVLCAALLLAGCGGGGKKAAKPNGEASKPPAQVLADAARAVRSASSMHIAGHVVANGTPTSLDFSVAKRGATGTVSLNGLSFDFVRVGDTLYVRGSDAFYRHFAGAAFARLLHGKWLKGSATSGRLARLGELANGPAVFLQLTQHHGPLVRKGLKTYRGQSVVAIYSTTENGTLYVATTGPPYPVAVVGSGKEAGTVITLDRWNQHVSLNAPKNALDLSALGAG